MQAQKVSALLTPHNLNACIIMCLMITCMLNCVIKNVHIISKDIYLGNHISENIYNRSIKQTVSSVYADLM